MEARAIFPLLRIWNETQTSEICHWCELVWERFRGIDRDRDRISAFVSSWVWPLVWSASLLHWQPRHSESLLNLQVRAIGETFVTEINSSSNSSKYILNHPHDRQHVLLRCVGDGVQVLEVGSFPRALRPRVQNRRNVRIEARYESLPFCGQMPD
jgi:hypothetical protein